jgi:hypothetical protein
MSNYLISLHNPAYGITLFKDGWTGNHRLDDDGLPTARLNEFHREYGKHGWIVTFCSNLTMFDDRRTYLVEQIAQILMGIKKLDFFPTRAMAQDLGINSGWTEIFAVDLPQLRGYQGQAVRICKRHNWNYAKIQDWIKATCQANFAADSWAEYKYGEKVFRTSPFNGRYNLEVSHV